MHSLLTFQEVMPIRKTRNQLYGWFTEGFDTADLQEAKTLLEELSQ